MGRQAAGPPPSSSRRRGDGWDGAASPQIGCFTVCYSQRSAVLSFVVSSSPVALASLLFFRRCCYHGGLGLILSMVGWRRAPGIIAGSPRCHQGEHQSPPLLSVPCLEMAGQPRGICPVYLNKVTCRTNLLPTLSSWSPAPGSRTGSIWHPLIRFMYSSRLLDLLGWSLELIPMATNMIDILDRALLRW